MRVLFAARVAEVSGKSDARIFSKEEWKTAWKKSNVFCTDTPLQKVDPCHFVSQAKMLFSQLVSSAAVPRPPDRVARHCD